ncbi:MAG: ECF transporter S component [Clostridia bacterium]
MNKKLKFLTRMAVLSAIIIILGFTPIGYIRFIPGLEITLITIPVAIGAAIFGPIAGLFLGIVFGITSFIQAYSNPIFGVPMLSYNVFLAAAVCILPRALTGFLTGLIGNWVSKLNKFKSLGYGATGFICSLLNTFLFLAPIYLVFKFIITESLATPLIQLASSAGVPLGGLITTIGITNGVPEAVVTAIICAAICNILRKTIKD